MIAKGIGSMVEGNLAWDATLQWPPVCVAVWLLVAVEVDERVGLVLELVDAVEVEVRL